MNPFTAEYIPVAAKHVVVIGVGNIGSHLIDHIARMRCVERVTIVDPDIYASSNLDTQSITEADIGHLKVRVQGRRIAALRPQLSVEQHAERVETVSRGVFDADVILACLDSLSARQVVNQIAFRLGVPWIDAGIRADGLLVRLNVYASAPETPCLECAWDQADYDLLEQEYPCDLQPRHFATGASSSLGALAASWQAIECEKLLVENRADSLVGRQVLIDVRTGKLYVTTMRRNPECRFDHQFWPRITQSVPLRQTTVLGLLNLLSLVQSPVRGSTLSLEGHEFTRRVFCSRCLIETSLLALVSRLPETITKCKKCGHIMNSVGAFQREALAIEGLSSLEMSLSLYELGFRDHDIVTIKCSPLGPIHCEIVDDPV